MNLSTWAKRQLMVVDDKGSVARVQLIGIDGDAWETWEAPFGDPEEWATEAQAVLASLADDWPQRQIRLQFQALTEQGHVRSRQPVTIQGRSGAASKAVGNEATAHAEAAQAWSKAMEQVSEAGNVQIDVLKSTVALLGKQLQTALEAIHHRDQQIATMRQSIIEQENEQENPWDELGAELLSQLPELLGSAKKLTAGKKTPAKGKTNGISTD